MDTNYGILKVVYEVKNNSIPNENDSKNIPFRHGITGDRIRSNEVVKVNAYTIFTNSTDMRHF